jgi:murein DD-endopeptidase MepM/ murein hydrolase activator NlpD
MGDLKLRVPLDGDIKINSSYKIRKDSKTKELKLHSGIDYKAEEGTKVFASASGEVVRVSKHGDFGNLIIIDRAPLAGENGRHIYTLYAHLSKMRPDLGEYVLKNEWIGNSGNTGKKSEGAHLHFGVYDCETALKWRTRGSTGVYSYQSDDPNWYVNITHSLDGTILDINDLNEKTYAKVQRVMELETTVDKKKGLWHSNVIIDGKNKGYLDNRNLELALNFSLIEAIEFLRKPMKERETDEYIVTV